VNVRNFSLKNRIVTNYSILKGLCLSNTMWLSAASLAISRHRLKTILFHLSYPDLIFGFASCFIVDLAIIFVI